MVSSYLHSTLLSAHVKRYNSVTMVVPMIARLGNWDLSNIKEPLCSLSYIILTFEPSCLTD